MCLLGQPTAPLSGTERMPLLTQERSSNAHRPMRLQLEHAHDGWGTYMNG